ncbi:predicted protein [Nematostella vectensis]|uniref:Uncharacterized protein n=1 Tax=Nematostella vectensis TaxID=45351 RepID=A7S372_NEMVE|nr:uncharacterized protein LOC5513622 [Nematostella vectensis]EDO41801.1 predicted protein [Nematostella vectensis]|eukprot:XP_001633864.1 predicted protein [Nematostella vectensis]
MAEAVPELKRDSTMTVTAKEGEAFLEAQGKLHDDAKTRAQQKELDAEPNGEEKNETPTKLERTTTMQATAKEGSEIIGDEDLGKTRSETENKNEDSEANGDENGHNEASEEKPALKRDGTMAVTAAEGAEILGDHDTEAGTRAEAKAVKAAIEESVEQNGQAEDEEKPDLKRKSTMKATLEDGEEFLKRKKESNGTKQEATA